MIAKDFAKVVLERVNFSVLQLVNKASNVGVLLNLKFKSDIIESFGERYQVNTIELDFAKGFDH